MSYQEALNEIREIARKIETEDPGLDEIENLLKRAKELTAICRAALRRVGTQLDEFQQTNQSSGSSPGMRTASSCPSL
jgi:exodeoxyribonuclease VII small subunit